MTLFDKYGGVPTIRLIVKAFYDEILNRPHLEKYFEGVDMPRLIEHQIEFVAYALGKPKALYPDESLRNGHKNLGVTSADFDEVANILLSVLLHFNVERDDVNAICSVIEDKRSLIVQDLK